MPCQVHLSDIPIITYDTFLEYMDDIKMRWLHRIILGEYGRENEENRTCVVEKAIGSSSAKS